VLASWFAGRLKWSLVTYGCDIRHRRICDPGSNVDNALPFLHTVGCIPLIDALQDLSAAVYGIDANIIEVEVDVSGVKTNEIISTP